MEGGALDRLRELGLTHAAVTAPLKSLAFEACAADARDAGTGSINTLYLDKTAGIWRGRNTDLAGFEAPARAGRGRQPVAVWGGGGTLGVIRRIVPGAVAFGPHRAAARRREGGWSPGS